MRLVLVLHMVIYYGKDGKRWHGLQLIFLDLAAAKSCLINLTSTPTWTYISSEYTVFPTKEGRGVQHPSFFLEHPLLSRCTHQKTVYIPSMKCTMHRLIA